MKIIVRNQAGIANKYLRFAKWKIRKLSRRFYNLIYSEIYVKKISKSPEVYIATIKMGVPGNDIIVSAQSDDLDSLWSQLSIKMKRQIRNYKERSYSY